MKLTDDRGAASVLALALIAAVVMIGAVVLVGAGTSAARIAVQHAADEIALAGARAARTQVALGRPVPGAACEAARSAARDHAVTVTRCVAVDAVVTIHVELADALVPATAMAVAGPAHAAPG